VGKIYDFYGYRVMIFTNDHLPPHVHFVKWLENLKVDIFGNFNQECGKTKKNVQQKMVKWVLENRERIIQEWNRQFSHLPEFQWKEAD
jgi:hypothetical protein